MPPASPITSNLAARALSASVLIPTVLAAIWWGGGAFFLMVAISIGLMAVEWGKMSAPEAPAEVAVTITVAVLTGVFAASQGLDIAAWALRVGGGVAAAIASRHRTERAMACSTSRRPASS